MTCIEHSIAIDETNDVGFRSTLPDLPTKEHAGALQTGTKLLDICKQIVYISLMIQTFASPETERFFATGKSRCLPPEILKRAAMRLMQLDGVARIEDLRFPPSNRLEALVHDRARQWSIRINDQWRVCFRFENGDAYDVEIVDYH